MGFPPDFRLEMACAISVQDVVWRLGISDLRKTGAELIGPCPLCGGRDRFGINLHQKYFNCRKCDLAGKNMVSLTMGVLNIDFKSALEWLCGKKPANLTQADLDRQRRRFEEAARKQSESDERYRRKAIADACAIWNYARPGHLGVVPAYLEARGITASYLPNIPKELRFIVSHPYRKKIGGKFLTVHRGPCMIASIRGAKGSVIAVHQTWIDGQKPHGKAKIVYQGETLPSKLVRGAKKGGAICLHTPSDADTLIMGEGIETTLTAMISNPVKGAAYWAGVDLGNMSGRMKRVEGIRYSGAPDLSDRGAFLPPSWVKRLVFIMDGDSDPIMTRAKLECGLHRAMQHLPGLKAQIVSAPCGMDLNDVLMGSGHE